jgi:hypothetical protein
MSREVDIMAAAGGKTLICELAEALGYQLDF